MPFRQFLICPGQFVLSKIDARNGAFGIVPEECDGAIITGNFWTYDVREDKLIVGLLRHFTQSQEFIAFCNRCSPGATNRRYLQERQFLEQRIVVPSSVTEQQMLCEALDLVGVASRAHEIDLVAQAKQCPMIAASTLHQVFTTPPSAG